jgi:hypothetical protein
MNIRIESVLASTGVIFCAAGRARACCKRAIEYYVLRQTQLIIEVEIYTITGFRKCN